MDRREGSNIVTVSMLWVAVMIFIGQGWFADAVGFVNRKIGGQARELYTGPPTVGPPFPVTPDSGSGKIV